MQEAQRAREEGEKRRRERDHGRRHRGRDRYRDRYKKVSFLYSLIFLHHHLTRLAMC